MNTRSLRNSLLPVLCVLAMLAALPALPQTVPDITGNWRINEQLSDETDKQVERALRASGQKVSSSWFDRRKDKYRGGPAEQELYDRFSYDPVLTISTAENGYIFEYADSFSRTVFTDNRSRAVSLTALDSVEDFSLGHWENERFLVEAHPRDGGFASEVYTLQNGGAQLQVEFVIRPSSFSEEIELKRVYDRVP